MPGEASPRVGLPGARSFRKCRERRTAGCKPRPVTPFPGLESASKGSPGLEQVEAAQEEKQPGGSVDALQGPNLSSRSTRGPSSREDLLTSRARGWGGAGGRGARGGGPGAGGGGLGARGGVWPSGEGGAKRPQRRKRAGGRVGDRDVESLGEDCRAQRPGAAQARERDPHPGLCGRRPLLGQRPPRRPSGGLAALRRNISISRRPERRPVFIVLEQT